MTTPHHLLDIETLHTRVVLPAVVIGFEVGEAGAKAARQLGSLPAWLFTLSHQSGGYATCSVDLLGVVLRWSANAAHAHGNVEELIALFQALGEGASRDPRLPYPQLRSLCETSGDAFSPDQLAALGAVLNRYFRLPPIVSGIEALVRLESRDVLTYFRGWKMLTAEVPEDFPPYYAHLPARYLEASNIGLARLADDAEFDRTALEKLKTVSELLSCGAVEAHLLWENSD